MIKILTIIGARPQIIKAAALSRAIRTHFGSSITELIVHTGQHYDQNMSKVFFDELGIPEPDFNLNVGSGSHGAQTATMIEGIERILLSEKPHAVVLYGDTNSTLAGAIAASKIHVPVVHIEAGLRSFSKEMPEEVNRILCDHVSTLLFSPTQAGFKNLEREGFKSNTTAPFSANNPRIYHSGDVMFDNSLYFSEIAESSSDILSRLGIQENNFLLVTIHRNNNTDEPERLSSIFRALDKISDKDGIKVILPLHPRTSKLMDVNMDQDLLKKVRLNKNIVIIPPVSFLEMIVLEKKAKLVLTDSGGVQKEAYFFKKPCVVLRPETEWIEIVENGNNIIADADEEKIIQAYNSLSERKDFTFPEIFGDGKTSEFICTEMIKHLN